MNSADEMYIVCWNILMWHKSISFLNWTKKLYRRKCLLGVVFYLKTDWAKDWTLWSCVANQCFIKMGQIIQNVHCRTLIQFWLHSDPILIPFWSHSDHTLIQYWSHSKSHSDPILIPFWSHSDHLKLLLVLTWWFCSVLYSPIVGLLVAFFAVEVCVSGAAELLYSLFSL